jgi:hypothetical protein
MASTEEALARLACPCPASVLNLREKAVYEALLNRDVAFFAAAADELAGYLHREQADYIITPRVEFYNPIHDMVFPLALKALAVAALNASIYEVPLIYQAPGSNAFIINRFPDLQCLIYEVPETIVDAKLSPYREVYHDLRAQFGDMPDRTLRGWFAFEHYRLASGRLEKPNQTRTLRYESRGNVLQKAGSVREVISYQNHYLPTVNRLLSS